LETKIRGLPNAYKEFISPIFVIGAPQCIKDSDIFVLKCINDFIIYNPVEDDLWMPTQSKFQTDKKLF